MAEINVLNEMVINKIAAGEVVERPASVVKELIENSFDAGCDMINIELGGNGTDLIIVEDNGKGILKEDLPLVLERHTTSKIKDEGDLFEISTLGFRGEAIAAIASISKMRIESRRKGSEIGYYIEAEGGRKGDIFPIGRSEGTRVVVEDLFFNTPARAKFLKSPQTEISHIISLVESYALSRYDTRISLISNGVNVLSLMRSKDYRERFFDLFEEFSPSEFRDVCYKIADIEINGIISEPSKNLSSPRYIFTSVNSRIVKDKLIMSSILKSYEDKIEKGRYPIIFLSIKLPFEDVDVNVHPTKREIKFKNPNFIYNALFEAISNSFSPPKIFVEKAFEPYTEKKPSSVNFVKEGGNLFYEKLNSEITPTQSVTLVRESKYKVIGIFRRGFILLESEDGLSIVDQHTLHERIRYEQFKKFIEQKGERKQFFMTRNYFVPRNLVPRISEIAEILSSQGFEAEVLSDEAIGIRSYPSFLEEKEIDKIVEEFISDGANILKTPKEKLKDVLVMRSCRGSVMVGEDISLEKAQYLIDLIFTMNAPLTCPHGRPVIFTLKTKEILARFGRK